MSSFPKQRLTLIWYYASIIMTLRTFSKLLGTVLSVSKKPLLLLCVQNAHLLVLPRHLTLLRQLFLIASKTACAQIRNSNFSNFIQLPAALIFIIYAAQTVI